VAPGLPNLALGGWPPGGLLVAGVGVGDGGHGGQVHRGQHGPDDQRAGEHGAWPDQLPPPAGPPPVALAARPTGAVGEPGLGGLLVSLGDALGGQLLA
jgi:hypothetical protein